MSDIRKDIERAAARPVWKTPNPRRRTEKLTPARKAAAKARAERAGRPYPNLIDNMWAARSR